MEKVFVWNTGGAGLRFDDAEASSLESLRSTDFRVTVADDSLEWVDLAKAIGAFRPTIFHFIGHGDERGNLWVPDGKLSVGYQASNVVKTVRSASRDLRGIYLSGCYTSRPGPDLLQQLAPAGGWVVGTRSAVDDDLAHHFAATFYRHLTGPAESPNEAFNVALAYAEADWGEEVSHEMWCEVSHLPPVDDMARTIYGALKNVFNRAAFQLPMSQEASIAELKDALQDVGHALGTGEVRSRESGSVIQPLRFPVDWLHQPEIRNFVLSANRGIADTRRAVDAVAVGVQGDFVVGNAFNVNQGVAKAEIMRQINEVDRKRNQIIAAVNRLFANQGISPLPKISLSFTKQQIEASK
ncbi:hypothetical protein RhoFasGS6_02092 [Rhodococcus fascians]|uniref:hypothetical protein n=1 Tax=Rhodococcoides fascians TaxID=1828 RepID=UPI001427C4F8|nr:hypothetical protein [Rhodococcus fascians]